MSEHTPGPWTVTLGDGEGSYIVAVPASALEALNGADGAGIEEFNARIITEAPSLFDLIEEAVEYLDEVLGDCDDDCECIIHGLRASIARVRGEA